MSTLDALGRATFQHIEKRQGIRPTPREIRWLKHIERHGPQSSDYLHAATRNTHRDPDTSRRQLQKLRAGELLYCPRQQRATENSNFNPYIYNLTLLGRTFLHDQDLAEDAITPTGHFVHGYMTACITASIDINARQAGVTYIPAHKILARSGATLGTKIDGKKLIPDQLFGFDYGGRYRFFCVEADRGTEPKISAAKRKSYRSMIENYARFIGEKRYQPHYGLTAALLLLVVFSSRANEMRFLEIVAEVLGERSGYILTQTIPGFHGSFKPPPLLSGLFDEPWRRAGKVEFRIDLA